MDKTKAAKNTTPSTTSTSTKSSFERLQELRAVEKRKRSDPDLDSRKRTKSESTDAKPQQTGTRKIQKTLKITTQTAKPISKPEQELKMEKAYSAPAMTEEDDFSDDDLFDALVDEIDKAQTQKAAKKK